MKKITKLLLSFYIALALCGFLSVSAAAAPAKVSGLTTKSYESSVALSWKSASGASGYEIYMSAGSKKNFKLAASTQSTSYTVKELTPETTYYFRIRSYSTSGGKKTYGSYSSIVSAKPTVTAPSLPSDFKCYQSGNGKAYFSWEKGTNANGYVIYCYNKTKKKYVKIASSKTTSCVVSGLTNGTTYKFKIRSYRSVKGVIRYSSKYSSVVKVTPQKLSKKVSSVQTMQYKATVTANVTASPANSSSKKQTVKKGTQVTVLSRATTCTVELPNGQQVYISSSKLNFTSSIYTTKDYSRSLKQNFVNQKGYSSPTKYLIWVSTYTQTYSLFTGSTGNWKLLRTNKIATGNALTPTSTRIAKITKKEEAWRYEDGTYQAPVVYFYGGNAFHSRLHNSDGSIADATIGKPVSSGCVRMYDADIQYIYKNCPIGTTVVIY